MLAWSVRQLAASWPGGLLAAGLFFTQNLTALLWAPAHRVDPLALCLSLFGVALATCGRTTLAALPLAAEIHAALLGVPGTERSLLDAVIAYERGEWEEAERIALAVGLPAQSLPDAYCDALRWTARLAHEPERKAV